MSRISLEPTDDPGLCQLRAKGKDLSFSATVLVQGAHITFMLDGKPAFVMENRRSSTHSNAGTSESETGFSPSGNTLVNEHLAAQILKKPGKIKWKPGDKQTLKFHLKIFRDSMGWLQTNYEGGWSLSTNRLEITIEEHNDVST